MIYFGIFEKKKKRFLVLKRVFQQENVEEQKRPDIFQNYLVKKIRKLFLRVGVSNHINYQHTLVSSIGIRYSIW